MKKTLLIGLATFAPLCVVTLASAQGYTPIVGIPGVDSNALSTEGYVTALYRLSITVACLLALYKIIFGGVKWALSDVVTDKGDAKKDIKSALLGLLIVLSAVLILNTINPNLTQLNIFGEGAPSIDSIEGNTPQPILDGNVSYPLTGPTSCASDQILTVDSSRSPVVRYCAPRTTSEPAFPVEDGEVAAKMSFQYTCINPSTCVLPGDSGFSKDGAYAKCDELNGQLDDDLSRIGWGICTYIVETTP